MLADRIPPTASDLPDRLSRGPDGNEQLTAMTGVILLVLLALIGVTILRIRQLISVHLFVGLLLLGPVAVKLGSTGYRFMRYYTRSTSYRLKGPPPLVLRLIAPMLVLGTVVVFASGVVLSFDGPAARQPWLMVHKASFIVWLAFTGLHVLLHLTHLPASLRAAGTNEQLVGTGRGGAAAAGRWVVLAGALAGGAVLAIVLLPHFASWTAPGAFPAHHHH